MDILDRVNEYINRFSEAIAEANDPNYDHHELATALGEVFERYGVQTVRPSTLHIAVLEVARCYGGPEEGGWWFDASAPVEYITVDVIWERRPIPSSWEIPTKQLDMLAKLAEIWTEGYEIDGVARRVNVRGGPDHYIDIDFRKQQIEPQERPRYE